VAKPELLAHVKFGRLQRALGLRRFEALGILEALWQHCWTCSDDAVGTAEDLAWIVDWTGDAASLAEALAAVGFLDPDPAAEGCYLVHDCWRHAPKYARLGHARERAIDDEFKLRRAHPIRSTEQKRKSSGADAPPTARVAAAPRIDFDNFETQLSQSSQSSQSPPMINARVLERLCHELAPGDLSTWGDAADALKCKAAYFRVPYNGSAVTAALERVARGRGAARFAAVVGARGS
jgi:hypothetical protein